MPTILFIDHENVPQVSLGSLAADWRILIFVGKSQKSIPFEIIRDAQQLGARLQWIKIEGDGRNNLDFHLAFYLGQISATDRESRLLILSKDKGFDSLIKHAVQLGLKCKRIERLPDSEKENVTTADSHYEKAVKILSGIGKNSRPRKRKTLVAQIASCFQNKEPAGEVDRIVELLFARKLVSEANNALTYHF